MSQLNHHPRDILADGFSLNFLHYGKALDALPLIIHRFGPDDSPYKKDVINYLRSLKGVKERQLRDLADVVCCFGGISERRLNIGDIGRAIEKAKKWRSIFHSLKCRGFSFRLCENAKIRSYLKSHLNVRIALIAEPTLYYPPKVREGLEKFLPVTTHVPRGIGWMLGTEQKIDGRKWWFIVNIQSDLMSTQISSLKEIFRGWQRVLLQLIIILSHRHGISTIALPSARAVTEVRDSFPSTQSVPTNWQSLYDGNAEFFKMKIITLQDPIDLQTMSYRGAARCSELFVGDVSELWLGCQGEGVANIVI